MREIDPSHDNSEFRLRRALRSLSASSLAEPPAEIGDALTRAFRRHHARRRVIRRTAVVAAIFAVLLPAAAWLMRKHPATPTVAKAPSSPPAAPVITVPAVSAKTSGSRPRIKRLRSTQAKRRAADPINDFVALPSSDQAVRGEDLRVVRLELTGRALRMVGAPVSNQIEDRRILADFVVGQDGTPYAVRLVR